MWRAAVLVMAGISSFSGCSDECGSMTANLPSQGGSYDSYETCSAEYATFAADLGPQIELFLQPDSSFSLITTMTARLDVDTLTPGMELSMANGLIVDGGATWYDGADWVDPAGLTYGTFTVTGNAGTDRFGNTLVDATWEFRWGDTSSPMATWYRHTGSDTIKVHPP